MKTQFFLLMILAVCSLKSPAQGMPVYDNTNFLTLGKSLLESAKQTSQLFKTVNFLKEQKERLEQVSNIIREIQAVEEIIGNHQHMYEAVHKDLREILNSPFIKAPEIDRISSSFNSILEMSRQDMEFMQKLLTSNLLNMTDAERLEALQHHKKRSREMLSEIRLRNKRYRSIISFREMQEKIQSRDTNF